MKLYRITYKYTASAFTDACVGYYVAGTMEKALLEFRAVYKSAQPELIELVSETVQVVK